MSDEPVRNPTKKSFWRLRNLAWLVLLGAAPLFGHGLWGWAAERVAKFNSLEERLADFSRRDVQAVWNAVSKQQEAIDKIKYEMAIMNRLFDREWGRGTGETEKALTERMRLLDTRLKSLITLQAAMDQLIKEHKARNPDSKVAPVKSDLDIEELLKMGAQLPLDRRNPEKDPPPYAELDPASLRAQYERRIPAQQKK